MPVYPGDGCSRLYQCASIPEDGVNDHRVESGMHVGTHIDAPLHMVEGGAVISDFPASFFQRRGVLIDARFTEEIDAALLHKADIRNGDIVLVRTDWSLKFHTESYYKAWPYFTEAFAHELVRRGAGLVGMDTPSPDIDESFPVHKILLPKGILIIENLTNLSALSDVESFKVHAYPVKFKADAAPVRVVAEISGW